MSSTILASQNGQPVECPNLPSGACSAANGANLIADTVLQPNVVVSDVNGAGACFYLTVTGSSGAGIVDDLSLAAQPWQIVAQAAITFANTKRGSEDPSITHLKLVSDIQIVEGIVAAPTEAPTSSASGFVIYGVLVAFCVLFGVLF
eukprot:TRINITY_DN373_c0_g1_i1.p1 TRINITY_DN373_c0_g1~~TRINITY_DN373_c0_g1_i1.p1  ORF type:complete len:147 (-),score=36.03 TRINITY_DN373_c0_g1_i1:40-480(-)